MKSLIPTPHDRFFRNALSDPRVAKEFFKTHLPENIRQLIDFDKITPCKESYVDEQLKLSISDMLFTAQFKDGSGYLYLLNEHLSHPRKMIAFYLLKSMLRIMDEHLKQHTKLPIVYPLIFYTGKKPYHYSTDVFDLFENPALARNIFLKPFQLVDIQQISDEELRRNTWLGIMELSMKHVFDEDILPCVRQMASLFREAKNQEGGLYLGSALVYLLSVVDHRKKEDFIEIISESVSEEIGEDVMVTVSQYYERQGFKKGIGEGVEKGRKEGKMSIARELLSRKMPLETISEITKLSVEELKTHLVEA